MRGRSPASAARRPTTRRRRADARSLGRTRLLLGTHAGNARAIRFYRRNGFEIVGSRTFTVGEQVCEDFVFGQAPMKLSAYAGRGVQTRSKRALTTEPGYRNPNGQIVIAATGVASASRPTQRIYKLRCETCGHEYGVNGMDIKARLCPAHQGGEPANRFRNVQASPRCSTKTTQGRFVS